MLPATAVCDRISYKKPVGRLPALVSAIFSDLLTHAAAWPLIVRLVAWGTLFFLAATLLLLSYTLLLRIYQDQQQHALTKFKSRWRPILFAWLAGKPSALPKLHKRDHFRMLELWHDVRRQLDNESADGLNKLAEELKLDRIAVTLLQHRRINAYNQNVWLQILAIRVAKLMNTPSAREAILLGSASANFLVNIEATCALVEIDHPEAEYHVLETLLQFNHWVPYIANKVSRAGGSEILHLILKQIDLLDDKQSRNLFSLLEYTDDRDLVPQMVTQLYRTEDPEIQSLIIRSLGRIGDSSVRKHIIPFLHNSHAWLRLHAVIALGKVGYSSDMEKLVPLISDPDWWVRYRAAQTYLAALKYDQQSIETLKASISDHDARETLVQVLAEKSL